MPRSTPQTPPFTLVIGTFASTAYIHLQLEARRRLYPDVPVLVHDDASPAAGILLALCGAYGAGFIRTPLRLPPCKGDLSAFARGLDWARGLGADVLVKLSRRFIPLTDWRPSLAALAGRHPVAGITTAFARVSGGFSANLLPGQLDALLFGITEKAAETLNPAWNANIAGNWYFIAAMLVTFLPVIWWVTDRVVEPRLGVWDASGHKADDNPSLTPAEKRGLKRAGLATLGIVLLWVALVFGPGTPLVNDSASPEARLSPLYQSLVAAFFLLFFVTGWAYGSATGVLRNHRDAVDMMTESMKEMAYYLVLAFFAAHFVQMFQWSNMGLLMAINGANALKSSGLPVPVLLAGVVLLTASVNLFIGSASAKWLLMAPVLVPMLMLLGVSPEMTTATYRVGDSATNIITPLMVYFPLVLTFCQRWMKDCGMGTLLPSMVPYSMWILLTGLGLVIGWVLLDLPLGPGGAAVGMPN